MLDQVARNGFTLQDASEEQSSKGAHEIVMRLSFHRLQVAHPQPVFFPCAMCAKFLTMCPFPLAFTLRFQKKIEVHCVLEGRKGGVGPKPRFHMYQVCSSLVPRLGLFCGKQGSVQEACLRERAVGWARQTVLQGNSRPMHTKGVMRQLAS